MILALLLSAIFIASFGLLRPEDFNDDAMKNYFWTYKVFDKNKYDILILGDSRTYRGISPAEIEKQLPGNKAKNLGFGSAGFSSPFFDLANQYLDKSKNRGMIIMGITPASLIRTAAENGAIKNIRQQTSTEVFTALHLAPFLSFFNPVNLADIISSSFGYYYKQKYAYGGWLMGWKKPEKQSSTLKSYISLFTSGDTVVQSVVDSLFLQVRQWTGKNILVFGFRFPASNELMAIEDSLSGFDEEKLRTGFSQNGGIWLTIEKGKYHTYDGSHLGAEVATQFSIDLALRLKSYLEIKK